MLAKQAMAWVNANPNVWAKVINILKSESKNKRQKLMALPAYHKLTDHLKAFAATYGQDGVAQQPLLAMAQYGVQLLVDLDFAATGAPPKNGQGVEAWIQTRGKWSALFQNLLIRYNLLNRVFFRPPDLTAT